MNKSTKIGILLIASFLMILGFSQTTKAEENLLYLGTDNVYYKCQGKPMTPQTDDTNGDNKIASVDLASVKILNNTFFTDKNNVYYISTFNYYCYFYILTGADSATFKILNNLYEKDKNSVYYNSFYHGGPGIDKVQTADSATFEVFKEDGEYGMDKNYIFFQGKLLSSQNQIITNTNLYNSIKGKIILKVEDNGEAYYVSPNKKEMYSLSRPVIAFRVMREQGIGIINANLEKIPVGGKCPNYNSNCDISNRHDLNFAKNQKGKIFIQVEGNGEAWYVNSMDSKRYFLDRPTDAFNIMKTLGLGISNTNFNSLTDNNISFNDCGKIDKYKNESWYQNVKNALQNINQSIASILDTCQSLDKSQVIILTNGGNDDGLIKYCEAGSLFNYNVSKNILTKTIFDDHKRGCVSWPSEFGKRDGNIISLQGSGGDAGAGSTMYYDYNFVDNKIELRKECNTYQEKQISCTNY